MILAILFTIVMAILTVAFYSDYKTNPNSIERNHASSAMILTGFLTFIFPLLIATQWAGFAFLVALALMVLFLAGMVGLAIFLCDVFAGQIGLLDTVFKGDTPAYFKVLVVFILAVLCYALSVHVLLNIIVFLGLALILIFGLEDSKPEWLPKGIREIIE